MPGMAANPSIFERIKLPEDQFKIHWLYWKIPTKNESLSDYVDRLLKEVKHKNPVLVGVSFGGVIVQEMSKKIDVQRLIIISSIKTNKEFPRRMNFMRKTGFYRMLPTSLVGKVSSIEKLPVGNLVKKRAKLYQQYLDMNKKEYLDWAILQILRWQQSDVIESIIHIHGSNDLVFPRKYIEDCIEVKGGTHVMIINRFKWFNENLPNLILHGKLAE
ncbi:alpha/beta hydrolase [Mesonia sp. K7]|nr:alpha/beta hydrolase [Mesonia sp. K7]